MMLAKFWGNQFEKQSIEKRFWSKVDVRGPNECWPWLAGKDKDGYGRFRLPTGNEGAHRMAWFIVNGPIPEGLYVLHFCDQTDCSNPVHLWLGTNIENTQDRNTKDRQAKGEKNGEAKLSESDVLDIRSRYTPRIITMEMLAKEKNVTKQMISLIVNRKNWQHV